MDVVEGGQLSFDQAVQHWYYLSKFHLLQRSLRRLPLRGDERLADFGCGLGVFLRLLELNRVLPAKNMCGVDSAFTSVARVPHTEIPIYPSFSDHGAAFDVVLLMDVLEHIEDDTGALAHVARHCKTGSHLFITVPAFPFLWSKHDDFLGHYRRYTERSLRDLVLRCGGLSIVATHYYYGAIFPVAAAVRLLRTRRKTEHSSDLKPVAGPINTALALAGRVESRLAPLNHLGGLSVVALCRKM